MIPSIPNDTDPRWGTKSRDRKALAILSTMRMAVGEQVLKASWLDVGCGNGGIAATLSDHVESVIGVDPERWKAWGSFMQSSPRLRLVQADCANLHRVVPDGSVDVAVCNQVYEHVPDVAVLLRSIHRALRADGFCYFAGPNLLWPIEPHVHLPFVHWLPRQPTIRLLSALGVHRIVGLDAWSASYWQLKRLFRDAGFEATSLVAERLAASQPCIGTRPRLALLKRLVGMVEPFSPGFVFLLTKRPSQ